jgi:argininosuccinate lyase
LLTVYQREHLLPTYQKHAPMLYPPTVEASRAHVVMLYEQGLIPHDRAHALLSGLDTLRSQALNLPAYDGTFEDVYFAFERDLAAAAGIEPSGLDVQLARSRNDLDSGIFRMILRRQLDEVTTALASTIAAALDAAARSAHTVVIGLTHRRPAQPTTLGHILAGYAEAAIGELRVYDATADEIQRSPFGAGAFAGTDLPIAPTRVADLLGFEGRVVNSYEAVAGADHLLAVAFANARALATGARLARLVLDWMTWEWVETPAEFCQGSSIMPQKRNPVVLEHMVSMAGMAAADAASVVNNVSCAWWEDSNNATTDVQVRLWESNDRARRFFTLLARLLSVLTVKTPPSAEVIVASGATTTAATDVLAHAGLPFRAAHAVLGHLIRRSEPALWTVADVREALGEAAPGADADDVVLNQVIEVARRPEAVLGRAQDDGPGTAAVLAQVETLQGALAALVDRQTARRRGVEKAAQQLDQRARAILRQA